MRSKAPGHDATLSEWLDWLLQQDERIIQAVEETSSPTAAKRAAITKGLSEREAKKAVHLAQLRRDHLPKYKQLLPALAAHNAKGGGRI